MLPYPDDRSATPDSLSLYAVLQRCNELLQEDENAFVRFILAGRQQTGPQLTDTRAWALNLEQDLQDVNPDLIIKRRDYDSLIGATITLPYRDAVTVWPIPPFRDTLKTHTHIRAWAIVNNVSNTCSI